ncbi:chitinase 2-like [Curcuma longa]|uniref:chitinase 2-like n=1 Tax=Curcuma longa TaxID=136217 RepID=UPI003D9EE2D6
MASSPSTFSVSFLLLFFFLPYSSTSGIFREYIGAEFSGVRFSDVPISSGVEFHFILAFAIDYTTSDSPTPTNGRFNIFWDNQNLSPAAIAAIKRAHPNVKVALSLGGDSVGDGDFAYFAPDSVDSWVNNAVESLTSLIRQYHIDGIDVDYEHFRAAPDAFAESIGQLVSRLKGNGVISFASIAPFDDDEVQSHYKALWSKHGAVIDYVNFQFYAYASGTTVAEFLDYFDEQRNNYRGGRVLASFNTEENPGGLTPQNGFFRACNQLKQQGKLGGIFVWTADASMGNGFRYEQQAQKLLASA